MRQWIRFFRRLDWRGWRARGLGFTGSFLLGLLIVLLYSLIAGFFSIKESPRVIKTAQSLKLASTAGKQDCQNYFRAPGDLIDALKSSEVEVRRQIYRRLWLQPVNNSTYFDYERDLNYPEQAANLRIRYLNLDENPEDEAIITFIYYQSPVTLVLKKRECGWEYLGMLSAWLPNEDYPYDEWLDLIETVNAGVYEILIHESNGDKLHYQKIARLFKVIDGQLLKIAEFEEETLKLNSPYGFDRDKTPAACTFENPFFTVGTPDKPAHFRVELYDQIVQLAYPAPEYRYWSDIDNSWHHTRRHWHLSPMTVLSVGQSCTRRFNWDGNRKRFVEEEWPTCREK